MNPWDIYSTADEQQDARPVSSSDHSGYHYSLFSAGILGLEVMEVVELRKDDAKVNLTEWFYEQIVSRFFY